MKSLQYVSRTRFIGPAVAAAAVTFAAISAPLSAQTTQEEFNQANTSLEALMLTNQQLRDRIVRQEQLIQDMAASIEHATLLTDHENSPFHDLAERMMSSMEQFVEDDLPFELEDRRAELDRIRGLVDNPEASAAQKISMLIALYQAENGYGRTLETYETTMEVAGVEQEVTVTRIGRIMLAYQTSDRSVTAVYDKEQDQWVELSPGEFRSSVTRAQNVANGSLAPELMNIPIPAPEPAQ